MKCISYIQILQREIISCFKKRLVSLWQLAGALYAFIINGAFTLKIFKQTSFYKTFHTSETDYTGKSGCIAIKAPAKETSAGAMKKRQAV